MTNKQYYEKQIMQLKVKIADLKKQIDKMKTIIEKKYCKKCLYRKDNELFLKLAYDKNAELKQQIEKMKCCCNCDWSKYLPNGNCLDCGKGLKNWKLKE